MTLKAYEWLRTGDSRLEPMGVAACDHSISLAYDLSFMLHAAKAFREQTGEGFYSHGTFCEEWAEVLPTCPKCLVMLDSVLERKQPSPTYMPRIKQLRQRRG